MPRAFYKFKVLLDEGMHPASRFPRLNQRFDIKHIVADFKMAGITDKEVFNRAVKLNRLVVTFNDKDFKRLIGNEKKSGVIGVSANLSVDQIDKKLTSLLMRSKKSDLFGNLVYISGES
jgi:predicted nuclease of predicted toxin-antitoxin system